MSQSAALEWIEMPKWSKTNTFTIGQTFSTDTEIYIYYVELKDPLEINETIFVNKKATI